MDGTNLTGERERESESEIERERERDRERRDSLKKKRRENKRQDKINLDKNGEITDFRLEREREKKSA